MTTLDSAADFKSYDLYIDGKWVAAADGRTDERTSPADGRLVGRYAAAGTLDVDRAVAAARRTFDDSPWPTAPAHTRALVLQRAAALLRERRDELARRITLELGKPIRMARTEVDVTAEVFEYYGALALDLRGELVSQHTPDALGLILHEPVGVVGMITPWNFPLLLLAWKVGPAIAAGCTIVAKPSPRAPGGALELATILSDAGAPDGVYNVVTGGGADTGAALAAHRAVDKIAFTGSTAVGREVLTAAGSNMKKVSLELGGKSPNIIFPDADLDAAVPGSYWGIYLNSGQACQAGSRLLVHRDVHDEFVSRMGTLMESSRIGDPLDRHTMIGPLVDQPQLEVVMGYVERGSTEGAALLRGGQRKTGAAFADGFYVEPTMFDGVTPEMSIGREEIFGPVLSVMSFANLDEAIRLANQTMYGLAAGVWTRDLDVALRAAKGIRAGTVFVNSYHDAGLSVAMPFGGYKASGFGRELGREGLSEYLQHKSVHIQLRARTKA